MFHAIATTASKTRWEADRRLYALRRWLKRARRAAAYALDKLDKDDARQIAYDVQYQAGEFSLITLDESYVLSDAQELWQNHPALPHLVREACQRVASKWEDYTEVRSTCAEWALRLAGEYAKSEGIELAESDEAE